MWAGSGYSYVGQNVCVTRGEAGGWGQNIEGLERLFYFPLLYSFITIFGNNVYLRRLHKPQHTHTPTYAHTPHTHERTHTHTNARTHTHTHTHTHTYTHSSEPRRTLPHIRRYNISVYDATKHSARQANHKP